MEKIIIAGINRVFHHPVSTLTGLGGTVVQYAMTQGTQFTWRGLVQNLIPLAIGAIFKDK